MEKSKGCGYSHVPSSQNVECQPNGWMECRLGGNWKFLNDDETNNTKRVLECCYCTQEEKAIVYNLGNERRWRWASKRVNWLGFSIWTKHETRNTQNKMMDQDD